jgi:hypothetical protein
MISLVACGALERFPVFDGSGSLAARVDGIPRLWRHQDFAYRPWLTDPALPAELRDAVARLLARSRAARSSRRRGFLERLLPVPLRPRAGG